MTGVDAYVRHAQLFGTGSVIDVAEVDLSKRDFAALTHRLNCGAPTTVCATSGCAVAFVPSRKGQVYHSVACRQKAKRIRAGQDATVDGRRRRER